MDVDVRELNRLWRFCGTAFSFFAFGVGGLVLAFFWFPSVNFFVADEKHRKRIAQKTIQKSFLFFIGMMKWLGLLTVQVEGKDVLQAEKGSIIVANHPSLIDYVLITSLLPQCDCIVKQAMWKNPFARGAITAAGYIPNADTADMLAKCKITLGAGGVMLIFPEGTRTVPGQPLNIKRGAAHIAIRTHSDLRIVHIQCNQTSLTKGGRWYQIPPEKLNFLVQVKEKVNIQTFLDVSASEAIAARRLTDYLTEKLVPEIS